MCKLWDSCLTRLCSCSNCLVWTALETLSFVALDRNFPSICGLSVRVSCTTIAGLNLFSVHASQPGVAHSGLIIGINMLLGVG